MDDEKIALFLSTIRPEQSDQTVWIRLKKGARKRLASGGTTKEWENRLHKAVRAFLEQRKLAGTAPRTRNRDSLKGPRAHSSYVPPCKQGLFFKRIRAKYGLSRHQYLRMLIGQGCKCSCCYRELVLFSRDRSEHPVVDHCHATGVVRGLLCIRCNTLIGRVESSPAVLDEAKRFLERHAKGLTERPAVSIFATASTGDAE